MISDDNFSLIQRTLLLQFTLVEMSVSRRFRMLTALPRVDQSAVRIRRYSLDHRVPFLPSDIPA